MEGRNYWTSFFHMYFNQFITIYRIPCQPISAVRSTLLEENRPHKEKKWQRVKGVSTAKDKMPLIVFGDGMFGKDGVKIKGHESGIVGILYRMLKRREARGEAVIVTIDEYRTSQVRND